MPTTESTPSPATESTPWVLVLDDDPTGTQGISDVPVVIQPSEAAFQWAASLGDSVYALTNTRAMASDEARRTVSAFVRSAQHVAASLGRDLLVVNRSDSTLRGHFPVEVQQIAASTGGQQRYHGCLLVPAFPEAGRVTLDGVHYLRTGDALTPVAETEFATDSTFGYTQSRLTSWARPRVPADWRVVHLPSSVVDGGVDAIVKFLDDQTGFSVLCPSVRNDADLTVIADAQRRLHRRGVHYLVQAGPSYARHLARSGAHATVTPSVIAPGVVVVGSHTRLTTDQLLHAQTTHQLHHVEIDATLLLGATSEDEIARCTAATVTALATESVMLATSRVRKTGTDRAHSLTIANHIAAGVAEIARRVAEAKPGFMISKGGITSRDVAAISLGWEVALVEGPLVDRTLPVWSQPERGGQAEGTRLVIFPGNIGAPDLLSRALDQLAVPRLVEHVDAGA